MPRKSGIRFCENGMQRRLMPRKSGIRFCENGMHKLSQQGEILRNRGEDAGG
jgi:hypothetical protein